MIYIYNVYVYHFVFTGRSGDLKFPVLRINLGFPYLPLHTCTCLPSAFCYPGLIHLPPRVVYITAYPSSHGLPLLTPTPLYKPVVHPLPTSKYIHWPASPLLFRNTLRLHPVTSHIPHSCRNHTFAPISLTSKTSHVSTYTPEGLADPPVDSVCILCCFCEEAELSVIECRCIALSCLPPCYCLRGGRVTSIYLTAAYWPYGVMSDTQHVPQC